MLVDDRKQHTLFDYWFEVIKLLGKKSPVQVVLNQRGGCKITNYDHLRYVRQYQNYFAIDQAQVDLGDEELTQFRALRRVLQKQLQALPHVGSELPANWKPIRRQLADRAESENTITLGDYRDICVQYEIKKEADQMLLLRYLNDLGVVLHFEGHRPCGCGVSESALGA